MANGITETIGLDTGDRYTRYSILDERSGEEVGSGRVRTTPGGMERFLENYPRARVVLEVGTHSRWVNQVAQDNCAEVFQPEQIDQERLAVVEPDQDLVRNSDLDGSRLGQVDGVPALGLCQ